jgi:hypothetical protein
MALLTTVAADGCDLPGGVHRDHLLVRMAMRRFPETVSRPRKKIGDRVPDRLAPECGRRNYLRVRQIGGRSQRWML